MGFIQEVVCCVVAARPVLIGIGKEYRDTGGVCWVKIICDIDIRITIYWIEGFKLTIRAIIVFNILI